jgi:hypothetical protein
MGCLWCVSSLPHTHRTTCSLIRRGRDKKLDPPEIRAPPPHVASPAAKILYLIRLCSFTNSQPIIYAQTLGIVLYTAETPPMTTEVLRRTGRGGAGNYYWGKKKKLAAAAAAASTSASTSAPESEKNEPTTPGSSMLVCCLLRHN